MTIAHDVEPGAISITRFPIATNAMGQRETLTRDSLVAWLLGPPKVVDLPASASSARVKASKKALLALWAPGTFAHDHRAIANVERLWGLGFDLDEEPSVPLERAAELLSGFAGVLHTTFSHRPEAPRMRGILWTDRPITGPEYRTLHAWVASRLRALGIGVGKSACDPSRGWFVPARPSFGVYEARAVGGEEIAVDAALETIRVEAEAASKPKIRTARLHVVQGGASVVERARAWLARAEPAVSGQAGHARAFATIERVVRGFDLDDAQALDVLSDWNRACSPPWSQKELLHKIQDGRARGDTPAGELRDAQRPRSVPPPSSSGSAAEDAPWPEDEPGTGVSIVYEQHNGKPAPTAENVARFLAGDPGWAGGPRVDTCTAMVRWPDPLPARLTGIHRFKTAVTKVDYSVVQSACLAAGLVVGVEVAETGVRLAAARRHYDSLTEHVKGLPAWDGVPRLDSWVPAYLGCDDTPYHRVSGRAFICAAVGRAMCPGLLVDIVPVLEGKGNAGKNYAMHVLFGDRQTPLGNWDPDKDHFKRLACERWVLHDDEFEARKPREIAALKSWVSRTHEEYTPKYSNDVAVVPRRALLVCSTNQSQYLSDPTGNRRWYPWVIGEIAVKALERDREQLLAEALAQVAAHGVDAWRTGLETIREAHEMHTEDARADDMLGGSLLSLLAQGRWRSMLAANDLAALLGVPPEKADASFAVRLGLAVKAAGGHVVRRQVSGTRMQFYSPPEGA